MRLGLLLAGLLALAALAAPWLAPHPPGQALDPAAGRFRPPGTRLVALELADGTTRLAERVTARPGGLVVERLGRRVELAAAEVVSSRPVSFPLGTDRYGRDLASRLLHGARVSLLVGGLAALGALLLGTAAGLLAGLGGRLVEAAVLRSADALLAFPRLFLVLAAAGLWRAAGALPVIVVLALTGWMEVARVVRAEVQALRRRDFVEAARLAGVGPLGIVCRHLLPHVLPTVTVLAALRVGDAILVEAALSYLGLGIQPPAASWGNLIADGQDALLSAWWVSALPGLAIAATVLACNLVAEGMQKKGDWRLEIGD